LTRRGPAVLVWALLAWVGPAVAAPRPARPFPIRGVTLSLFFPEDRDSAVASLDRIVALGATHVALPVALEQSDVESDSVYLEPQPTPSDSTVQCVCDQAHRRGLQVALFPLLHVHRTAPGVWRGTLRPRHWPRWFASYRAALGHYARLAESVRAEWLCVGAELVSSESQSEQWKAVVEGVRREFHGQIFYSRNWDHPGRLGFEGSLDLVGRNAYFELTRARRPGPARLQAAWRRLRARLLRESRGEGPLLFTEVGYPSADFAARRPWDYGARGKFDPALQAACLEAFFRTWAGDPRTQGAFVYWWSAHEGGTDSGYSIRGRPAETTVARWYRGGLPPGD